MRQRSFSFGRAVGIALAAPLFAGLVAFATTSASCGVGDQYCPDDTLDTDLGDDCPYGPPGGPQEPRESCPTVVFSDPEDPACADVDFQQVFDTLIGPPGNCLLSSCHGLPTSAQTARIYLPDTPAGFYEALGKYKNGSDEPYAAEDAPRAWILCNLQSLPGGGSPMPKPAGLQAEVDQIALVKKWVGCGMKPPKGGGSGPSTSSSSSGEGGGTGGSGDGGGTGGGGGGGTGGAGGASGTGGAGGG